MIGDSHENVIEWLTGEDMIAVTAHQKGLVSKIEKYALSDEKVTILARNADGSIFARLPLNYLKLSPKRRDNLTEEYKKELAERMEKVRRCKDDKSKLEEKQDQPH